MATGNLEEVTATESERVDMYCSFCVERISDGVMGYDPEGQRVYHKFKECNLVGFEMAAGGESDVVDYRTLTYDEAAKLFRAGKLKQPDNLEETLEKRRIAREKGFKLRIKFEST